MPTGLNSGNRSTQKRQEETLRGTRLRVQGFKKYADKFRVPVKLQDLRAKKDSKVLMRNMEIKCVQEFGADAPSRMLSAQYFDANGEALFYYLGVRWRDVNEPVSY